MNDEIHLQTGYIDYRSTDDVVCLQNALFYGSYRVSKVGLVCGCVLPVNMIRHVSCISGCSSAGGSVDGPSV